MLKPADLPDSIPIFPLKGTILLPRAQLPLNVFEPRYIAMVDDVLKTSARLIGVIQPAVEGDDDTESETEESDVEPELHAVGCVGRLVQFSETPDERYRIVLTGLSRHRVSKEIESFAPYRRAEVAWDGYEADMQISEESDDDFDRPAFLELLKRYFAMHDLNTDWEKIEQANPEHLVNSLSMQLGFETRDKQALLEAPTLCERRETLSTLLEFGLHDSPSTETQQ